MHPLLLPLLLTAVANAHFQLQFPSPRGPFDEDKEPTFCDGYESPGHRSLFPLSGGFFSLNSEHSHWTAGVLVSTSADPSSFGDFKQAVPFFKAQGEGEYCFPLDFTKTANTTNLQNGQNITIQVVFNGGDGQLYQCADLTVSDTNHIGPDIKCSNATGASASPSIVASTSTSPSNTGQSQPTHTSAASERAIWKLGFLVTIFAAYTVIL